MYDALAAAQCWLLQEDVAGLLPKLNSGLRERNKVSPRARDSCI